MSKLSLSEQEKQVRIELAAMFRLTARYGWDDTVWNHITARAPGGEQHFYMHKFGLMYDEVTASNLIKVDETGKVIEGPEDVNTTGFIIHSAVHLNFPEQHYVFHTHPRSAIAATALKELPFWVQDSAPLLGRIGYHEWEGVSLNEDERSGLAAALKGKDCLVMRNHGLLTVGRTAGECFMRMYYLIRTCEVAVQLLAAGDNIHPGDPDIWEQAAQQYDVFPPGKYEWPALMRMLDRKQPDYRN